jgi:hypothetical protein
VWDLILWRVWAASAWACASVIAPTYIAEVSPAHVRGRLGSLQQLAIVLGIFAALLCDAWLANAAGGASQMLWFGQEAWRWMFLVAVVPALVYGALVFGVPESPRHLVAKGRLDDAVTCCARSLDLRNENALTASCHDIEQQPAHGVPTRLRDLRGPRAGLLPVVWIGILLSVFQQFVGINVIFYYSSTLWHSVGFSEADSFRSPSFLDRQRAGHAGRDRAGRQARAQALVGGRLGRHGADARVDGLVLRPRDRYRRAVDPAGRVGHDRAWSRRTPTSCSSAELGADGVGAARRDVPQPHPRDRAGGGRIGAVAGQLPDHRDVPVAGRDRPDLRLRPVRHLRGAVAGVRGPRGARDQGMELEAMRD